ncbi:MAG: PAS domain S-box protein [Dehalogenimonas sp.]
MHQSETRYRNLVEQTVDGIFVADAQGHYIDVNTAGAAMFGYSPEELCSLTLVDLLAPEEVQRLPHQLSSLAGGSILRNEWLFRRKDGTTFTGELVGRQLPDGHLQGILRDTTERRAAEEKVIQSQARERRRAEELATMIDVVPIPIIIVHDREATHMTGNRAANELLNVPQESEISLSAPEKTKPRHFKALKDGRELSLDELPAQRAARGETVRDFEFTLVFSDGTELQLLGYGSPIFDDHGNPRGAIHALVDITEHRKAERIKDEFIGMISHELKTPITVVIGALLTATMPGLSDKMKDELYLDAVNHTDILASIVDNLLELSRHQNRRLVLRKKLLDVGDVACKVTESLKRKSDLHVLKCDFPERLPKIQADPLRLERIFYNLVENAIKYSPAGGEVRIFADIQDNFLRIGISDQGIGISEENLNRLFQPFERLGFEVKGAIQGTGMGLRVCRILTEAHDGRIWVDSTLGKGTTFYFTLPLQTP